jgi:DNA replication protein DnaC
MSGYLARPPPSGVERGLRQARFPYVKTLDQFDFSFQPAIDRKLIRELARLAFVERVDNLILLGPPATGKTMLAVGIKAIEASHRYSSTANIRKHRIAH